MTPVGYYGKVATHGDFVARRLPPSFIDGWDAWLQAGLLHCQQTSGRDWLDIYCNGPVWHFALSAGLCGPDAMVGVMIPSVDRVGRYFPLTLCAVMDADGGGHDEPGALPADLFERSAAWFDTLEKLALSSLLEGFALASMDLSLIAMGLNGAPPWMPAMAGLAAFRTAGSPRMGPTVMTSAGLPPPAQFRTMFAGTD